MAVAEIADNHFLYLRLMLQSALYLTMIYLHDDVIKRNHFPHYWPFVRGNYRSVARSSDIFFDLRLNNIWANNRDAGDWRRRRPHYDVTIMSCYMGIGTCRDGEKSATHFIEEFWLATQIWLKIAISEIQLLSITSLQFLHKSLQ